jgi:hypothetical protein
MSWSRRSAASRGVSTDWTPSDLSQRELSNFIPWWRNWGTGLSKYGK